MNDEQLHFMEKLFSKHPEIKLVYFFGSRARGSAGPTSDFDFAFYTTDLVNYLNLQAEISGNLSLILKTDAVDVTVINRLKNPDLAFNIIKDGKLIYEKEPYKILFEPKILNDYFDFKMEREKNKLAKVKQ